MEARQHEMCRVIDSRFLLAEIRGWNLVFGTCFALLLPFMALGEMVIAVTETEEGIQVDGRGRVNTSGLGFFFDDLVFNSDFGFHPGSGMVRVGDPRSVPARLFRGIEGPTQFGLNEVGLEVYGGGDVFGVLPKRRLLVLPRGYLSGSELSGFARYPGIGLHDLGLEEGVYVWQWGGRERRDRVTVQVASDLAPVSYDRTLNLLQNGSFESGQQYWASPGGSGVEGQSICHGERCWNLETVPFAEQVLNLYAGHYRLVFSLAVPTDSAGGTVSLVIEEQGLSFPPVIETQYHITDQSDPVSWKYRIAEFEVPERVGKSFGQFVLRFEKGKSSDTRTEKPAVGVLLDDVQLYRTSSPSNPLLRFRAVLSRPNRIEIHAGRPGRVFFEISEDLEAWSILEKPFRVFGSPVAVSDPEESAPNVRFYRGRFDSHLFPRTPLDQTEAPEMVWIEPGTFELGSPESDPDRDRDEAPITTVTLTQRYGIGVHEVTQSEYFSVMGLNPSRFRFDWSHPVTNVRWQQAMDYCRRLTHRERQLGRLPEGYRYRLPTEAQWDYACQSGQTARYHYGDDPAYETLGKFAWYEANSEGVTHPVKTREANAWGIHGLYGNVHEWCLDRYGAYPGGQVIDPSGAPGNDDTSFHVIRGGSWMEAASNCRRSDRHRDWFEVYSGNLGFRVALVSEDGTH